MGECVESLLKVRKIDFEFPLDIDFQWNPANPYCGNFVNFVALIAPAFERYFIRATKQAMPLILDPQIKHDAQLFCYQEGQHSKHHLAHFKVLAHHCPQLEQAQAAIAASYEQLFEQQSLNYHLAYAATIELMFGPVAQFVIEHKEQLFNGSDSRIASFMLWHLIEEFEHRHAAIDIYKQVCGSHWYRLKVLPSVVQHIIEIDRIARSCLREHAPLSNGVSGDDVSGLFRGISKKAQIKLAYQLSCTLLPYHSPDSIKAPAWALQWLADEAAGKDMRRYFNA